MKNIFLNLQSMPRKKIEIGLLLFIMFEAICIFPLKYEFLTFNVMMVYCYIMIGFVLCAVTEKNSLVILLWIIFSNLLGLGLRIWIEWGEVTITNGLTLETVLFTYLPVIIITYTGYVITKINIQNKQ